MRIVNIHEAKTEFSKLIAEVTQGEEIVIAKAGKPVAMLVPMPVHKPMRKPGAMKGKILPQSGTRRQVHLSGRA